MKSNYKKYFFSIGLLSLFGGIALKECTSAPEFLDGFLVGLGLVLAVSSQFMGRGKKD